MYSLYSLNVHIYNKDSAAFATFTASFTFFLHQCFLHFFFVIDNFDGPYNAKLINTLSI